MISIVLAAPNAVKAKLKKAGFREETLLVRDEPLVPDGDNQKQILDELKKLGAEQYLVSDYVGSPPT